MLSPTPAASGDKIITLKPSFFLKSSNILLLESVAILLLLLLNQINHHSLLSYTVQNKLYSIRNGNIYESSIRFAKKKNNYRYATHRD